MQTEYKNEMDVSEVKTIEYEPEYNSEGKPIAVSIYFDGLRLKFPIYQLRVLRQVCITTFETMRARDRA